MSTLTMDNSTYTGNHEIAPAIEGADENGWRKDTVWMTDGASTGDFQVGAAFEAAYVRDNGDGTFARVTEVYYVERCQTTNQPEVVDALTISAQYEFLVYDDLEDPGGSEIWADYEYSYDRDVFFHYDLAEAEGICRRMALEDQRFTLTWDGQPNPGR